MSLQAEITAQFDLDNKIAVVTGAASGLGRESARVLAMSGARVVLADIDSTGLAQSAALLQEAGAPAAAVEEANVSLKDDMERLANAAIDGFGRLDIWVNSAGIPLVAPVLETTVEAAEQVIAVNMMGTFWGCAAAARVMQPQGGGCIVNISSGGGEKPVPGLCVYGMTKAAVNQLTRTCAHEFGSFGVRVNAIAPAWIETPMGTHLFRDASGNIDIALRERVRSEQAAANPLGRNSTAMDIAMAVLYLASDASGFISGQVLNVNGGAHG